ncbi:hypothetical protein JVT61DRAFT_9551 [Boletus reticuloceps]|uniref:Uncharacterized protein n=1 Tax=Boletus reticuloceps TaxID=495285 RepID=A0A8I2YHB2_9AGAM|nr:hypothetical protein JVT61DRAFT_9551 [Boletus reticuloceps]
MDEAIITLRDSAQYGVAMFPETNESKRKGAGGDDRGRGDGGRMSTPQPSDSGSDLVFGDSKARRSTRRSKAKEPSTDPASHEPKKPFGGFALLDHDGERESTPRPSRQRTLEKDTEYCEWPAHTHITASDGERPNWRKVRGMPRRADLRSCPTTPIQTRQMQVGGLRDWFVLR